MNIMLDDVEKYLRFIRWYKRDMIFEKVWVVFLLGVVLFYPKEDIGYLFVVACCILSYCTIQVNMNYKYGKKRYRFDFMKGYKEFLSAYQALYIVKDEEELINYLNELSNVKVSAFISNYKDICIYGQNLKDSYVFTIFYK